MAPNIVAVSLGEFAPGCALMIDAVIAIPQCAIAHFGSALDTSRKAFSAAEYANECKSATARSKSFCTLAEQDVGNFTTPSFSGAGCSCSWPSADECQLANANHMRQRGSAQAARIGRFPTATALIITRPIKPI